MECEHKPPRDFGEFHELLFGHFDSLSPHLQRIAEYALGAPNRFALQTVAEVAGETGVQPSTLVRFAKEFGFSGYAELRQLFRARLLLAERSSQVRLREQQQKIADAAGQDTHRELQAFSDASILAIESLKAQIDADALREAVRLLDAARTIHVVGRGRVWPISLCLVHGLIEIKRAASIVDGLAGTLARQIEMIDGRDALIALGGVDDSPDLADAVVAAHANRVPVIAITYSDVSVSARHSSVYLVVRDADVRPFPPLAAHVVLAQSLILSLHGRLRDAEGSRANERGGK